MNSEKYAILGNTKGRIILCAMLLFALTAFLGHPRVNAIEATFSIKDEVDPFDGVNLDSCLRYNVIIPVNCGPYNVESLKVNLTGEVVEEGGGIRTDVRISVEVNFISELPSDGVFNVLMMLDTDLDEATGESEPICWYNGIGADWKLGCTVEGGSVTFRTIERYAPSGVFESVGEPEAELWPSKVRLEFRGSDIGDPEAIRFMAYVIRENFADMVPNYEAEPPTLLFDLPPVAVIEAPSEAPEGSSVVLDASASLSYASPITGYDWDLDGDGSTDKSSPDPWAEIHLPDDGAFRVLLTVETASGLTSSANHTVTAFNVPPSEVSIVGEGSLVVGEESTFEGGAYDPGSDQLTYRWDFGDGATAEGRVVSHSYQAEGEFVVTLTVTDDDGGVGSAGMAIVAVPLPPTPVSVSSGRISVSGGDLKEGNTTSFKVALMCEGEEPSTGTLKVHLDDPDRTSQAFWEGEVTLTPGENEFTTEEWVAEEGSHVVSFLVEGVGGEPDAVEGSLGFDVGAVEAVEAVEVGLDLLPILVALLGVVGVAVYLLITKTGLVKKGEGEKEEEEEKDFCEEHPEVVEQEEKAYLEAQMDLKSAIGDVQDRFDAAKPRWQAYARTVGRLMAEWDTMVALMAHWTGAEEELYETAEKAQKVAGLVRSASSKAAKALKEGGEEALKELGEDVAKDIASSLLGELSETLGTLLGLEDWAIREIGTGIARGLTGIDPRGNTIRLRERSELICTALKSWVSHSEAWNSGRRPPDTLQICIKYTQAMLDSMEEAVNNFGEAVADFRCVDCEIPERILEEMEQLRRDLDGLMRAFGDLIDQVEQRLHQARSLYDRRDVYPPSGYEWMQKSREHSEHIEKVLRESRASRGPP